MFFITKKFKYDFIILYIWINILIKMNEQM
jgi:hypothetical protein